MSATVRRAPEDVQGFHAFKRAADPVTFPEEFAAYIQSYGDIFWWPQGNFHVITKAAHAQKILKSDCFTADRSSFFMSRMPNMDLSLLGDFFGVVTKMMVMSDAPEHTSRRKAASIGFEDSIIDAFRAEVVATVEELCTKAYAKDRFDFVEEIASHLPCTVLANLFCIPEEDRRQFFEWSGAMTAFFGGGTGYENEDGKKVNHAAASLKEYFKGLIESRRGNPGNDYVSALLKGQERFGLTDDEVVSQATMMLVAGQVTTTDQICNNLFQLLKDPARMDAVRADPSTVAAALEEGSRFDPAVTFIFRVCAKDTEIGGQEMKAGETIFISAHCCNRDFELNDPLEFDLDHPVVKHFAFGYGVHFCIGAKLGRMEMTTLLSDMVSKWPAIEVDPDGEIVRDHYSLSFSGFKTLPVRVRS